MTTPASDICFDIDGSLARILLDRPKALNALTPDQIRAIAPRLAAWAEAPAVGTVVIEGAGERAFCAGGDIRKLYDTGRAGDHAALAEFYRDEYRLNRRIKTYPKPYVALIDGITMGGGVGLSVHGSFRVATERTLFAMPETGIGFFPDVGGTFFLPRCPGRVGLYLGLTGARVKAADLLYAGIATHHVPSGRIAALKAELAALPAAAADRDAVAAVIDRFHEDPGPAPLADLQPTIDRLFAAGSVAEILAALDAAAADDPWAAETRAVLAGRSPTALLVTFEQIRRGAELSFDAAMALEFRMAQHLIVAGDFYEGVRAVIIDKDNRPAWTPARLDEVDPSMIERCFGPAPAGDLAFD